MSVDDPRLGPATWVECAERGEVLLAVPLGSCEQHGPHLPLDTDARVAEAVTRAWAAHRDDVVVAPTLAYGASGEHQGFAGTLSLGTAALTAVLVELGRSADHFAGVIWVSGHGGNADAVRAAVERLGGEGRRTLAHFCAVDGGDAHAGFTETSILLATDPDAVRLARLEPGCVQPWSEIRDRVHAGGVAAVSVNGVLGDPTGADAAAGRAMIAEMVAALESSVGAWTDERH